MSAGTLAAGAPGANRVYVFAEGFDPILLTDYRGRILDGNRQALNFFGIERRSFPQINIRDLHHPDEPLPDVNKLTGPGSMSLWSNPW